jgi:hypothetical protein
MPDHQKLSYECLGTRYKMEVQYDNYEPIYYLYVHKFVGTSEHGRQTPKKSSKMTTGVPYAFRCAQPVQRRHTQNRSLRAADHVHAQENSYPIFNLQALMRQAVDPGFLSGVLIGPFIRAQESQNLD